MRPRFDGAVAAITGAAHGIGAACARRLAQEGAHVALLDRDVEAAVATAATLSHASAPHQAWAVDVTDRSSVDTALAEVGERFGRLDVLVNVAGGAAAEPAFVDSDDTLFQRLWELNFLGVVRTVRAALPALQRSDRAAIVTVSSVNGLMVLGSEAYSSAKAALGSLTVNLAMRYAPDVRVNAVAPGTTRTRVWDHQGGPDQFASLYPLARIGEPEDVAAAVAFLASPDAAWITGQVLPVDGGLSVRGIPTFGEPQG